MFNRPSYLLTVSVVPALIYQEFCPPLSPSPSPPPPDIKVWLTSGRLAGCMVGDQSRPQQLAAQTQTIHHRMVGNTQRRHESYLPSTAAISLYLPSPTSSSLTPTSPFSLSPPHPTYLTLSSHSSTMFGRVAMTIASLEPLAETFGANLCARVGSLASHAALGSRL